MTLPAVSVIIPVWRDFDRVDATIPALAGDACEIILAGSSEQEAQCRTFADRHPGVRLVTGPRGRAAQMNRGAEVATGRWLFFLHADSRPCPKWIDTFREADSDPRAIGGSFRFALDSSDRRARVIEAGVRARVALLGLPYGDQGLFVRRDVFERLGGYRDLPLMEDVDFVRRLARAGRLVHSQRRVVTSARRWETQGWTRRSAGNVLAVILYFLGVSPARLARRYSGRHRAAIAIMARAPWASGKTRLTPDAPANSHLALRHALFEDTRDRVAAVASVDRVMLVDPPGQCEAMALAAPGFGVLAQRDGDLCERLEGAFEDLFRLGYDFVVVVGSDLPTIPVSSILRALVLLNRAGDRVVLGPADDGGYYLVGLKRAHPKLFRGIEWSTSGVLDQTVAAALDDGVEVELVDRWYDVDDWTDLQRAAADDPRSRTAQWLRDSGLTAQASRSSLSLEP